MDTQPYRVRGVSGVAWAVPFYQGSQTVRLAGGEQVQSVLIGPDDATLIGGPVVHRRGGGSERPCR